MTYTVLFGNNENRPDIVTKLAAFESRGDAVAFVENSYDVIYADDDEFGYCALARYKGNKFCNPFFVEIVAR